jgi:hypothetical protein
MRISVAVIILLAAVACSSPHERPIEALRMEATTDSVGLDGVWLGMPHKAAQNALGASLPIRDAFTEACGSGYSDTQLAGHRVTIQWADDPPRQIESIFVSLPPQRIGPALERLSAAAGNNVGRCPADSPAAPYCFRHPNGMVVYGDLGPPRAGIRLSVEDCTD